MWGQRSGSGTSRDESLANHGGFDGTTATSRGQRLTLGSVEGRLVERLRIQSWPSDTWGAQGLSPGMRNVPTISRTKRSPLRSRPGPIRPPPSPRTSGCKNWRSDLHRAGPGDEKFHHVVNRLDPPHAMIGTGTSRATCITIRSTIGLIAGRSVRHTVAKNRLPLLPVDHDSQHRVGDAHRVRPAVERPQAISRISVTLGVSLAMIGSGQTSRTP